ncbi:hypothetical protein M5C90_12800 [Pseudomonas chlororaphis subsp. piscium]|nr:hypothetical protein M5C90_12800 [Pseudomonas chlororaphis subsp. piscium]
MAVDFIFHLGKGQGALHEPEQQGFQIHTFRVGGTNADLVAGQQIALELFGPLVVQLGLLVLQIQQGHSTLQLFELDPPLTDLLHQLVILRGRGLPGQLLKGRKTHLCKLPRQQFESLGKVLVAAVGIPVQLFMDSIGLGLAQLDSPVALLQPRLQHRGIGAGQQGLITLRQVGLLHTPIRLMLPAGSFIGFLHGQKCLLGRTVLREVAQPRNPAVQFMQQRPA